MADLAAVHDLEYDEASLQEDPIGLFLELTRGLNESPAVRGEDDVVASMTGRSPYTRLEDVLALEAEGCLLGIGTTVADQQSSYRTQIGALRALLAGGKVAPKVLACELEDGSTATINARVVDYQVTEVVASLAAEIKVAWESVDPDWSIIPPP